MSGRVQMRTSVRTEGRRQEEGPDSRRGMWGECTSEADEADILMLHRE